VLSSNSLALNTCEKKQTYIRHKLIYHNSYSNACRNPNNTLLYNVYSILHSLKQRREGEGKKKVVASLVISRMAIQVSHIRG
jgi:hypothetical protein